MCFEVFWSVWKRSEVLWGISKCIEVSEVFWSILKFLKCLEVFWSALKYFEVYWSVLRNFEIFFCVLKYFEVFGSVLKCSEIYRSVLKCLKCFEAFWCVFKCSEVLWSVWKCFEVLLIFFWSVMNCSAVFEVFWRIRLRPYSYTRRLFNYTHHMHTLIQYISVPYFCYMFRCIAYHLQGELTQNHLLYKAIVYGTLVASDSLSTYSFETCWFPRRVSLNFGNIWKSQGAKSELYEEFCRMGKFSLSIACTVAVARRCRVAAKLCLCWSPLQRSEHCCVESSWNAMAHGDAGRRSEGESDEWSG